MDSVHAYVASISRTLAGSLDYETTLQAVARTALPHPGTWCIVDLCDGTQMRRLSIIHPDPKMQRWAERLEDSWPPERHDTLGIPLVVHSKRSEVIPAVTDEMLVKVAKSDENLAILRALGIGSLMAVPMMARDAVLGAITYVSSRPGVAFSEGDLTLAEDVAARCAVAIDNARLFRRAEEARIQAEEADRAKMRFISMMSHELRTPLNAIAGYAELMELGIRGPLTPHQKEDLERILVNERHLLGLVDSILTYARLDAGQVEYGLSDVALREVLVEADAIVAPLARAKLVSIVGCDAGTCGELAVYADHSKMLQVVVNLLGNAVKFSHSGGRIDVECEQVGECVEVRVSDTGVGIAPEDQQRIFEPFVQASNDLTRTQNGTGLGLAISRALARGMGGDLSVSSRLRQGSTFTLTLHRGRD